MSRIIVSGSLAYDRIMDFDGLFEEHFLPDKAHSINLSFLVNKLSVGFGGTAGNIAYNLALLEEHPEIIATAGQDFSTYRTHLLSCGIDPTTIHTLEGDMTSSAYVLTDKANNQIAAFHPGAGGHGYDGAPDLEGRALAIVAPGCIPDMEALPEYYRRHNFEFLYDPAQQITALSGEALRAGINGSKFFFASDYELALILQKTGWREDELLQYTGGYITTYGAKGSRVVTKEGTWEAPITPAEKVVDPTGAGDAYRAGFIKGLLVGLPPASCAKLAGAVAVYAVEAYGTQNHRFTLDELKKRYKSTHGETLTF